MIKEALKYIIEKAENQPIAIDGKHYSLDRPFFEIGRPGVPDHHKTHTLSGLINFIENIDDEYIDYFVLQIDSPTAVRLFRPIDDYGRLGVACLAGIDSNCIDNRIENSRTQSEMIITLQTMFDKTDERDELIKAISNVVSSEVVEQSDDGCGQNVALKHKISLMERVDLKSVYTLNPFRTFNDIEQPASPYLLRVHDKGLKFSLYLADMERWKFKAMSNIKEFMSKVCDRKGIIII